MLCREFEIIACDLADERLPDERLMDAGKRERGLRHAADCASCAARLKAERALNLGLRALGENDETKKAPAHLKFVLRAAFDRQAELSAAPILTVAPATASRWRAPNWLRWSLAAAAMLMIAAAIALLFRHPAPNANDISGPPKPEPSLTPAAQEQPAPRRIEPKSQTQKAGSNLANVIKQPVKLRAQRRAAADREIAASNETVTDYIPLTYLADATAVDGGIVVRVELSRSALIAMGLPIGIERTETRVKADMIVGDDGVARAVRFVR